MGVYGADHHESHVRVSVSIEVADRETVAAAIVETRAETIREGCQGSETAISVSQGHAAVLDQIELAVLVDIGQEDVLAERTQRVVVGCLKRARRRAEKDRHI